VIGRHYIIRGHVQGVGFRYFVARHARALGLAGWVRNLPDGSVAARAAGAASTLDAFELELKRGPTMSRVDDVSVTPSDVPLETGFVILT
jgi:acylphosphatase